jgi:hypothetical protein
MVRWMWNSSWGIPVQANEPWPRGDMVMMSRARKNPMCGMGPSGKRFTVRMPEMAPPIFIARTMSWKVA